MAMLHRIPFHYHAEGHAISGEFRHPLWSVIPAQASASLSQIGGNATAQVEDFHHQDFVSFKSAHTHISGKRRRDETFVTHASTVIEGLDILGVVRAERIVCRLTSIHNHKEKEGHIIAEDSRFDGLRISGEDVKVILRHDLLVKCKTFDDLAKGIASDAKSGKIAETNDGVAICSLVEKIETKLKGVDVKRHLIEVPNFGKIFLAEIYAEPGTRTLTMLRLELGSPHVADITAAETRTNGRPSPP
ncbi:MAG TPA: hypothetical protein VE604_03780 [Candidatus Polarisedimenticolia bacterium]|nr:hypothetical protein [Candidatus Polarisedimenticolia bacterium]